MVGISSGVAVSITYNGITLFKCDRESNSCWIWISPLWLCSYCNVSPTQNVVWSYTRYSSQCCIGAIAIPSTSSWTTTKQQCWTNKNVEYQWENGFIVWDYSPLLLYLANHKTVRRIIIPRIGILSRNVFIPCPIANVTRCRMIVADTSLCCYKCF